MITPVGPPDGLAGQLDALEAIHECVETDLSRHARKRLADADMATAAERELVIGLTRNVERLKRPDPQYIFIVEDTNRAKAS